MNTVTTKCAGGAAARGGRLECVCRRRPFVASLVIRWVMLLAGAASVSAAENPPADKPHPASISVDGLGWWKNRKLRASLSVLDPEGVTPPTIDAAYIEDAVVVLQSGLQSDGFLHASGEVRVRADGSRPRNFPWTMGEMPALQRDLKTHDVAFVIRPGTRYVFADLRFDGLKSISEKVARSYFIDEGFILGGSSERRYSPGILKKGVESLREQLARIGHLDARVVAKDPVVDDRTGRVTAMISVDEGRLHRVGTIIAGKGVPAGLAEDVEQSCRAATGAVVSPLWQQDFVQSIRGLFFRQGYAEADVHLVNGETADVSGERVHNYSLEVTAKSQVHVGRVTFRGDDATRASVLQRATNVREGELFDRSRIESDRLQLGALGVFSSVRVDVQKNADDVWDLAYLLKPGRRLEASLLAGYGSYERLRGGIEVSRSDLFGLAHRARLELVESQKSSSGDFLYTVPQVLGTHMDASGRLFGLDRQEVSFRLQDVGASAGVNRHLDFLGADAALRYQFESVVSKDVTGTVAATAPTNSRVASITFDLTRDRRDNPLMPHRGYSLGFTLESASTAIGGSVNYQRLELQASVHRPIGNGLTVHAGIRHGILWSVGSGSDDIPLAKRYFPGGEDTVRGYREGLAGPRDSTGQPIGAEVSTITNLELEQALTPRLAVVVFVDGGLTARRIATYPGGQLRVSTGIGLRYNSVIGPARLEYGRNVVRESGDQMGELHFALGFPF